MKKYIHVWKLDKEGLVVPRKGGWTWGDWGDNKDLVLLYNLWYSLALEGFHLMADLLGEKEDSQWACQVNERLKRTFHTKYWNGNFTFLLIIKANRTTVPKHWRLLRVFCLKVNIR